MTCLSFLKQEVGGVLKTPKKKFHVDNEFILNPKSYGQFYLHQISDLACSDDYEVPEHGHYGYEISFIVSGEGVFRRNGVDYTVSKNMLFLISKNDTHYIRSSKNDPMRYVCVCFSFNKSDPRYAQYIEIENFLDTFDYPIVMDTYDIYDTFVNMLNEMANLGSMSEELVIAYLSQIIIYTYRSFKRQKISKYFSSLQIDTTKQFIYEIISCIDCDLTNIHNLQEMSKKLGYSYAYMSSVFSKEMGETIKSYYTRRRFERALELLENGMSIAAVSEKLGFKTVNSFSRAFRSYYHYPPGEYLKTIKGQTE